MNVVAGGSSATNLNDILGELLIIVVSNVAFFMCTLPLCDFECLEHVYKRVLVDGDLVHFNLNY